MLLSRADNLDVRTVLSAVREVTWGAGRTLQAKYAVLLATFEVINIVIALICQHET